jgi:hypothetical protein
MLRKIHLQKKAGLKTGESILTVMGPGSIPGFNCLRLSVPHKADDPLKISIAKMEGSNLEIKINLIQRAQKRNLIVYGEKEKRECQLSPVIAMKKDWIRLGVYTMIFDVIGKKFHS